MERDPWRILELPHRLYSDHYSDEQFLFVGLSIVNHVAIPFSTLLPSYRTCYVVTFFLVKGTANIFRPPMAD